MSKFALFSGLFGVMLAVSPVSHAASVTGAGASFPAPVYSKWADAYQKATGNRVNYQSIGSGAGIRQITAKTVDFGASDAPLKPEELEKAGFVQFPTVVGGVVAVVNLPGVKPGELKLTGALLADIYLGKITKWNDKAVAELNPGVKLPDQDIAVVRRADGSGTSFVFTNYLSKVSEEWKTKVGEGTAPQWPVGLGGKGNEGVSAFVQRISASIGYVEFAYAKQNKLAWTQLQNKEKAFVQPVDSAFAAAAASANWSNGFYEILTDEPGAKSWPITSATFIMMHKTQDKPEQGTEVLKFFEWAFKNGAQMASDLDYVPLPEATIKEIHSKAWGQIKDASGKPVSPVK
ncbi:MAG: phosphate ABC transporter substrate-binding protein PstS [Candidatus Dactylopiibacterium carminicum]|uniref:Phosphate-binding protein PstS n=1 Tax=Candidatus Dactylopiibacterium carminicum TaxID=857335 RepID=A0A272ESZ8_9RHOO|nr:phosphate ABC transporter substrate-binding protein PstS [Candidatus Dactylopiibacterium carminicum]KAF7599188.1 phosphate ABC transporter substrate-binding protein PstS [Candidatus Dactylopiibacterium carminicum]PAS93241.1 MAG: phosphate ABC transporter substrate-binding protein PstS [Candidatus Dactylopiibacterium carminicum]PAS97124.1 MAG: phosphate ABC transporter substrate-binding protein PstS [Candidatus Dactylopiibacterium carminicum]PAS99200.1 MAG: phosphate ABC transporter substrate